MNCSTLVALPLRSAFAVLATLGVLSAQGATLIVDQSQPSFTQTPDIATSGKSGQSFTTGVAGDLTAIRLVVEGKGFSGTEVFGSDFVLSLWSTAPAGTPTNNLLASGSVSRSELTLRDTAQWITVTFGTAYPQSPGEVLAFTIDEATAGADGFNGYGSAVTNAYAGGQMFFSFTASQPLVASSRDMAFETMVAVPEPAARPARPRWGRVPTRSRASAGQQWPACLPWRFGESDPL